MVEPRSLFAHILAQTRQNVELLMAHEQISVTDGEEILTKLPLHVERHPAASPVVSLTRQTQRLSMSPAPPKVEARAIWGWCSEDPNDLSFETGEVVEVVMETNADWWTGRNRSGKQGLFPSNYVEKLPPRDLSPILVPEPRKSMTSVHPKAPEEQRHSPALPYPALPQTCYPPPTGYDPPAGPPPGAVNYTYAPSVWPTTSQPAPQQATGKKGKFGELGQTMAPSAAGGVDFGAGAATGSELVNASF